MLQLSQILRMAKNNHANVGIGLGSNTKAIELSVQEAQEEKIARVAVFNEPEALVAALETGEIQAAVRGTLSAKPTLESLKSQCGIKNILRVAFLQFTEDRIVLLAPVGVDEGHDVDERKELITQTCELFSWFRVEPKVGILSGGRLEDLGRHMRVDETLMQGERLTSWALDRGVQARHYGILVEQAFQNSNMVLTPDGITGNIIFRMLHFFGRGMGIGAPVVNLDKVFIDTSRDKEEYTSAIALASALSRI